VWLIGDTFDTETTGGKKLSDWVTELATGAPGWDNVDGQ
jgi:hypothetical protein